MQEALKRPQGLVSTIVDGSLCQALKSRIEFLVVVLYKAKCTIGKQCIGDMTEIAGNADVFVKKVLETTQPLGWWDCDYHSLLFF